MAQIWFHEPIQIRCPYCLLNGNFSVEASFPGGKYNYPRPVYYFSEGIGNASWALARCPSPSCKKVVLVEFWQTSRTQDGEGICGIYGGIRKVYPEAELEPTSDDVPTGVRKIFDEAKRCFSHDCFMASAVMLRKTIESSAKECGIEVPKGLGYIQRLINELHKAGKLRDITKDAAQAIRTFGNDAGHENYIEIKKDDCDDGIQLVNLLLGELFIDPARILRLKKKK
jgi:hypothetical protein